MPDHLFDALARALVAPMTLSRRTLATVGSSAMIAFGLSGEPAAASKRRRRRRRRQNAKRRQNKQKVQLCHDGQLIRVARAAVEAHLQHGDQLGSCDLPQGEQTCQGPKLPCSANPTTCGESGSDCACVVTTTGGSFCAGNETVCQADQSTCTVDADCVTLFGAGFACVPSLACSGDECGGNRNACAPACPA